jgi:signal transduction histidine kinase
MEVAKDGQVAVRAAATPDWYGLFRPVVAVYSVGVVIWLGLGLLPTLADSMAPVRHWAHSLAMSSSPLAGAAARILDANQSMPGMALEAANRGSVALAYSFSLLNLAMGAILATRRSRQLVPCLLALAFLGTAATFNKPSHAVFHIIGEPWPVKSIHFTFHIVSGVAYLWAVLLFPDGHLPRQLHLRGKPLAAVAAALTLVVALISWRSSFIDHPAFFVVFFGVAISIGGLSAQTLRIADPQTTPAERRSARLLGAALLPAFATGLIWLTARAAFALGVDQARHLDTALQSVFPAVFAIVPVVLFAGILRYRLWNIDWLLSRALLYGTLGAVVSAAYIGTVAVIGDLDRGGTWTVVIVLGVVAVAIDPLRSAVRSWSNRIVYGQVLSPAEAVRTMLSSLDQPSPTEELTQLTKTVTQATRAQRSELWLASEDHLLRIAAFPESPSGSVRRSPTTADEVEDRDLKVPVTFHGRMLGSLTAELPASGHLGSAEIALIQDLAAHAGVVVHNAVLNTELARHVAVRRDQLDELRASRRRLVAAQDSERRKLERDLHDGAQQSLVAILIGLRTAVIAGQQRLANRAEIQDVSHLLRETSATLADLVSDQGPRALADQGLIGALRSAADIASRSGPMVRVVSGLTSDVPEELTSTIYFCCLEAIQNASKHAEASEITVTISEPDGMIAFEVTDNGVGFDPSLAGRGSGLGNLAHRVSVLGGDVIVESAPACGTTVRGWLPLPPSVDAA